MKSFLEVSYDAGSYSRLSKDDGDKAESNSIANQKELIRNFLKSHPEIQIAEEYSDDGYSGINFERPDFQRMMADVRDKKINCILVKDLSRFGRNYIETGKYMEQILPFFGVRFIAINDNYDSAMKQQHGDQIILPFKNLVNDTYCRDISIKVRSNLDAKRKKGDYVAAFAPYGYQKSEKNHNQLIVDLPAAIIVKRIFQLKIEGMSNFGIADILNKEGVPTPYEHKKQSEQGKNYQASFFVSNDTSWSVPTIIRILENEMYLGHVVQGKSCRPNYKIQDQLAVDKSEWIRVEDTHEAIIEENDFKLVQKLLLLDTRTSPGQSYLHLLSGITYCANCGEPLFRRTIAAKKEKYIYYGCYTKDKKAKCKGVSIREHILEQVILTAIQNHVGLIVEMDELLQNVDDSYLKQSELEAIDEQINRANEEILRCKKIKASLYNDYREGVVQRDEFIDLKQIYRYKEEKSSQSVLSLTDKKRRILNGNNSRQQCVELFKKFRNITELDRRTLVTLVSKVTVYSKKKIDICFTYQDEFEKMCILTNKLKEEA